MTDQIERTNESTFESLDPRTGLALATYPIASDFGAYHFKPKTGGYTVI